MSPMMCATVFGASFGYVSNSNVPFSVSTTITGPAPGEVFAGAVAVFAGVCLKSLLTKKRKPTIATNGALMASRIHRPAGVLSPGHEIQIDQRPPTLLNRLVERLFCLLGRAS